MFRKSYLLTAITLLLMVSANADDSELFVTDVAADHAIRPQVLIIFDTSGSMKSSEEVVAEPYDANVDYLDGQTNDKVYWSVNNNIPSPNSGNYLRVEENNCNASLVPLKLSGRYIGNMRRWHSDDKRWKLLSGHSGSLFDCKEDTTKSDTVNSLSGHSGYPINSDNSPYSSTKTDVFNGDDAVMLYSANYVYWKDSVQTTKKSRLSIAKEAITNLIASTPSVDFGVAIFNDRDGGRVVNKVMTRDSNQTTALVSQVNAFNADGLTPLCETMYEALLYYSGGAVYFGDDESDRIPSRDLSAEASGVYVSPIKKCQERAYIIAMTDGQPTGDNGANSLIASLTGNGEIEGSYMPTLAQWMNNNDIDNNTSNGNQYISTYTIGFGQDVIDSSGRLLNETAIRGGGEYYPATSALALQNAFNATLLDILNSPSSLTSPSVANNNFDRTRSLDSIYFSMFIADNNSVWRGNIKKLSIDNRGVLLDRLGEPAIDELGNIKENASTYWGGDEDGNIVTEGGVVAMLSSRTSRKVLSDISTVLVEPSKANLKTYYQISTDTDLADKLSLDATKLDSTISWLLGKDVTDLDGDNSITDYRPDIFADALHSSPLAVTYTSGTTQTVRLLVGTNAGFLHMFTDHGDTVSENWAYIPSELLTYGVAVKDKAATSQHSYGLDLSPVVLKTYDTDGALDKIIAVIGMRRGGRGYYALDITNPDNPSVLWKINGGSGDFSELGQSWSTPTLANITYKISNSTVSIPVFVFGGGYDINKDDCLPSTNEDCSDSVGRAIYMVNALTGEKVWSVEGGSCDNADAHCLRDSIPAKVSLLDSNGDGYSDRLYVADTGGNIWRVDFIGGDRAKWSLIKLASLGGDTSSTDRRFFTSPVLAKTYLDRTTETTEGAYLFDTVAYDGILIGSGDRANPASKTTVENAFYLIYDFNVSAVLFGEEGYLAKPKVIVTTDLYDISNDPIGNASDEEVLDKYVEMSGYSGWKYILEGTGEKSLGKASLLQSSVYFSSFTPNSSDNIGCGIGSLGMGLLYGVNIHSGIKRFAQKAVELGARVPEALAIHAGVNENNESVIRFVGVGAGDEIRLVDEQTQEVEVIHSGSVDTDTDMMPRRIYKYTLEK